MWGRARAELEADGHDVIWAGDWSEDPGDDEILAYAVREGRVLVTLDKDFGDLVILHGRPHAGILRLVGVAARQQAAVCQYVFSLYEADLVSGAIITAEPGRLRIRRRTPDTLDEL